MQSAVTVLHNWRQRLTAHCPLPIGAFHYSIIIRALNANYKQSVHIHTYVLWVWMCH